jgi:hypothetical protein
MENYIIESMDQTLVVIRSYANENVKWQVQRLQRIGFKHILVVVNIEEEIKRKCEGFTKELLKPYNKDEFNVIIHEMKSYSYSNALNFAITLANMRNSIDLTFLHIFNVSVEALFNEEAISKMYDLVIFGHDLVGVSFEGYIVNEESFEDIYCNNTLPKSKIDLGKTYYLPRNTGMLINLVILNYIGHFESWCDTNGGMEDFEFLLRSLICSKKDFEYDTLDLKVPLLIGLNYNQREKELREATAMGKIVTRFMEMAELIGDKTKVQNAIELITNKNE